MPAQALNLQGKTLLIVDDNNTNRRVLHGMLSAWQINTIESASGAEALAVLERHGVGHFDGIILDAQMPEMDGYQLAKALREQFRPLPPMLMLSSSGLSSDAQQCRDDGIAGYFIKPIAADELLLALARLLNPPAATPAAAPAELLTRTALHENQLPLRILLAEDHPTNQKLALNLLGKWGHAVTLANNGLEAFELFTRQRFDLVLMDMQMPVMGGIEATRRIRAYESARHLQATPIIAMTAAAMESDRLACLNAGMDDYLAKPIHVRELQKKLLTYSGQP